MYTVAIFALVLLSPLPFVSPFAYDVQDVAAQESIFDVSDEKKQSSPLSTIPLVEPITSDITTSSNNTNPAYANAGDTITVNFKADETLHYNATATIHGKYATVSILDDELNATITILETDPDGYANFEINVSSNSGEISLSGENLSQGTTPVFVDKRIPVITLNGPSGVFVTQGEFYTEFGASAIDGDPLYSGTITDNSSSITTGIIGTYTVEYTAPDDGAGNAPFSKTRKVFVQDTSLTSSAKYINNNTILLRFNTNQHAFFSGNNTLTSAITVDGTNVKSAAISGQIKSITTFDDTTPGLEFIKLYDDFAYSISPVGDINDDGYEDIVVGIPRHASESSLGGAVAIVHLGENAESILDVFLFDGDSENMPELSRIETANDSVANLGSKFGEAVENVGDINGDGFTDIAVGANFVTVDGVALGSVYVLFLGPNGSSVLGYADINSTIHNGKKFGYAVTNMGDLNDDGISDILVSAPDTSATIIEGGKNKSIVSGSFFILHLGSDGLPLKTIEYNLSVIQNQVPSFPNHPETSIGLAVENMGDLNNDGNTDVMITSFDDINQDSFIYTIHLGKRGETIINASRINIHGPNFPPDLGVNVDFGSAIAKLNDINGDGYTDMIISAPEYQPNAFLPPTGAFYVLSLGADGTSVNGHYEISSATIDDLDLEPRNTEFQSSSSIARSIAVLGDLNSNGAPNIVLGTPNLNLQGGLHVLTFAGYNDNIPHVIIKTNTTTDTAKTSNVVIDTVSGDIQLQLVPTSISIPVSDGVAPRITSITPASNTSLSIEFSENIIADTEFKVDSFRISDTNATAVVKNVTISGSNTVLLNTTVLSSADTPLVEIFNSVIKDGNDNSIEYTAQIVPDQVGPYPINAFWAYVEGNTLNFLSALVLFDDDIFDYDPSSYTINNTSASRANIRQFSYNVILFKDSTSNPIPFAFNQSNLDLVLAPRETFVDDLQNIALKNFTIKVEQILPARILRAETGVGNNIILTLSKNMGDVETTDFTLSDSLSLQTASVEGNKIILVTTDQLPSNSTPTITISGNISDSNFEINNYVPSNIPIGTTIDVSDGIRPTITSVEYDNYYNLNISYSEPIRKDLISEEDFEIISLDRRNNSDVAKRVITSITTSNDNLSTSLTFDRKLHLGSTLQMSGLMRDIAGLAMLKERVTIADTISPFMYSARTLDTTSIEITFNEDISSTTLSAIDFSIDGGNTSVIVATVLNNKVRIDTDTITVDATPVITLIGSVSDIVGNIVNSGSVTATDAIAPSLNSLSITSDNINSAFAKSSDTVTLTLVANEPVSFLNGHILGKTPQTSVQGNTITASVDISENTSNGPSVFTITISDGAGNTKTVTELDITANNVNIDTQSPIITLIGSNNTSLILDAIYIDGGSIVTDNDPNYVQTSATVSENIDSTVLGASYLVTYSAQADSAGNIPKNQTKNVTIKNVYQINVTSLNIASSSGNNYANAGKTITLTLVTDGTDLGNFTGTLLGREFTNITAGGSANFTVTVRANDTNENATFSINMTNSSGNQISISNADIEDGSYVTIDTIKPEISLIGTENITLIRGANFIDLGAIASDTSYDENTTVYSSDTVNTNTIGTYTLNYTAPADNAGNPGNIISRTVHVQDASPIEIVSEFNVSPAGTLTIGTDLSEANEAHYSTVNVFQINDTIYALMLDRDFGNIVIANVTDPISPSVIYENNNFQINNNPVTSRSTSIYTTNDTTYAMLVSESDRIWWLNISNPESPSIITSIQNGTDYPNLNHMQGSTTVTIGASIYALVTISDSNNLDNNGVNIINITNLSLPVLVSFITDGKDGYEELHGSRDVTTVTIGASIYALVAAYIDDGVQIIDITDPYNATPVSHIADGKDGYRELDAPISITTVTIGSSTFALVAANIDDGVQIINITDPYNPLPASDITDIIGYENLDGAYYIATVTLGSLTFALVTSLGDNGIQIINITDPYNPLNAFAITDNNNGYTNLDRLREISIVIIDDSAYGLVTSINDGLQIIKLDAIYPGITGNNTNPKYAKTGDTITLQFTINDTIASHTSQFLGLENPNVIINDAKYSATITVPSTPRESYATFAVEVVSNDGVTLFVTESDISQTNNVFVDTIGPGILLIGSENYDILQNDSVSSIPNVTVTDGDPNYAGTFSVTTNGTLNTSVIGSTVLYTYTANPDEAGNAGNSTSRLVTVVEPEPITINSLAIASSSGTNYANTGKTITLTLVTDGTDLGNFTGTLLDREFTNITAGGSANFTVTVRANDTNENATFSITMTNSSGNQFRISNADIRDGSFVTIDTIKPVIVLTGGAISVLQGDAYQEPGTAISDSGNVAYAGLVSASSIDTTILGLQNITYTGTADAAGNVPDSINRTITVLAKPLGLNSLTIESNNNVNTSFAKDGDVITVTLVANGTIDYIVGTIASNSAIYAVTDNTVLATVTVDGTFVDTANVTFSINAYNEDNSTFTTFTNADLNGSNITIDTTAPSITLNGANNTIVATNSSYTDPGATATDISYATGSIQVSGIGTVNTTTASNYTLTYTAPDDPAGNPGNTISRTVRVQDASPLEIVSIFNVSPVTALDNDTAFSANVINLFETSGKTYVLLVDESGSWIIADVTNPASPSIVYSNNSYVNTYKAPTFTIDNILYTIAVDSVHTRIIDISSPASPSVVTTLENGTDYPRLFNSQSVTTVTIGASTFALVVSGKPTNGVQIINVTNPHNPSPVSYLTDDTDGYLRLSGAQDITTVKIGLSTFALVASFIDNGVQIINITDPYNPLPASNIADGIGGYDTLFFSYRITTVTVGSSVYALVISSGDNGVQIINITDPYNPLPASSITDGIGGYDTLHNPFDITTVTVGSSVYALVVSRTDNGVQIIDITDPYNPKPASSILDNNNSYTNLHDPRGVISATINGTTYAFVASNTEGLQIIKLESSSVGITGNNSNPKYAKTGDTITLQFTINDTIASHTSQFLELENPNVIINDTKYSATITVPSTPRESYVTFAIQVVNNDGATLHVTENDVPLASNVFIDTIKPGILLIGSENYNILQNDSVSSIPNVTVTDGDPNYAGTFSVTTNGTLNTSVIGSTVLYTYTANPDGAGNEGNSTSRLVTVTDIEPITITSLNIASSSGNNYANANKTITLTLVTGGTDLGNFTGTLLGREFTNITAGGSANFTVIVRADDTNENATFSITMTNSSGNQFRISNTDITDNSFVTIDTINPVITLVNGSTTVLQGETYQDPGTTISDENNASYAGPVSASSINTTILGSQNITYTGTADAAGNEPDSINRTITVLAKPLGLNSLTIISDNNVNTSFAKDGDVITVTLVANGTIGNVTGIIANNSVTYTVNGNNASATVTVNGTFVDTANVTFSINASNEDNLTFRTFTNANLTGSNIAIDTTAPSITLNGANNTIVFTNFAYTDKNATATDVSYATGSVQVSGTDTVNTATAGNYTITYTAPDDPAGNPGNTISRTVRVQDASPLEIVSIFNDSPVTALLRGTDFISDVNNVRYTSVNSFKIDNISYALLLDREFGNIIIINITNPASPILVYENNSFTNGSDGFTAYDASIFTVNDATYAIAVTKDKNDVWILNISNPESPFVILTIKNGPVYPILDNLQGVTTVTIDASVYALITDRAGDSVQIIDVTNPASPKPVSLITDGIDGYEELDGALGITTIKIKSSIYALVASYNDDGVQIIDITDPYNPASVSNITDGKGGYDELNGAFRITAVTIGLSTFALVASIDDDGVQIINITDPYNPQPASSITDGVGGFNNTNDAYHITTTTIGASVFALVISVADNSVNVIDITDPYNPKLTSVIVDNDDGYTTLSSARETSVITIDDSTYILVTAYNEGIQIIKLGSSSIGITGNNSNPKYAKAGDTLVLGFIINDTITSHTSQFLELENPNVIINDTKYSATITVPSTPRESYATFAIQVVSNDSATYVTENDVPLASNVFIDTIKPGILLIGSENYNILQNAPVSSIPNVTVTDGDPNYAGTFSVTTNGTLNTSVIGSIVLYTYTANPDGAGNAGNSTSRLVTVTDIEPITINSLNIASSSGNNYANANKTITLTLVTDGTDLGNFTGTLLGREFTNITAGGSTNFTVTVRANDTNENATFSITMTNSSGNQISISNADIEDGSYVTIDTINPEISLIGTENIILIRGTNFTDSGAIASDTSYDENIIVYSTDTVNTNTIGTYTLNYTAPADNASNPGNTISRTVHVQDASPLEIVSIFNDSPVAALVRSSDNYSLLVNDPDARYNSVDTFKINNVPYALFLTQESTDILILNITNPASPKVAYENNSFIYTGTTGYIAHDVSIFTVNDDTYAIAVNEIKQFWILNISNPESPFVILDIVGGPDGSDDYPTFVRLNGVTIVTINASVYALITDRTGDSVQIVDVTNPVSPKPVSLITDNVGGYEELEGAAGITTIKIGSSIYALVASFNDDGVQIIDITDPYNPTPVSNITDGKGGYELDGALRITTITIGLSTFALVVAQLDHSVQIIDITDPYNPKLASNITDGVGGYDKLRGVYHIITTTIGASVYAIVASESDDAINVIDITDPYNPKLASAIVDNTIGYPALDSPREISVITIDNSTYISVISYEEGIQIIKLDSSSIGITGNNSNPQYAKAGDTLVLGFTINDTIASHTSQFLELENPNVIIDDTKYSATITVPSTPRESYATFAIQVANNDGATLNVTENDVPLASNVFIDTIKPRILLTGPQDYVILQNDSVSSIPNVTVTDGDPNYDGTFSVTTNGTLNTSVIGSTVLYTYTANPDGAGNVGDSINRTVTVAVFEPITITSLNIASSSGTNYANAGKNITLTLVTDGMDLGNFTVTLLGRQITTSGSTDGTATFTTTVQPGDDTENVTFSISATNSTGYRITGIKNDAITDGSYVTVDTVAPQITLNGDNNTIVMLGETFTDPGATATDASYASSILVNGIGTVTDTVGNHTLSYTAPIDPAGNTGPTITRTVLVKYFPKPEIVKLEIQIPSSEPYRKAGQVFDIVIAVNDVIKGSDEDDTATVFGMSKIVEYSNNKTGRIVNLVPSSPNLEQNITFEITVFNLDGVSITVTESDLTGPNVFVDNVAPRITLPSAVNVISINDPIPEIIAIATDGDPDYNGMVLEPVGSVDNTVSGIYPITYTASADNAGNPGSSATIIIAVNDESGTLILNSSVLDYGSQSFSTGDVIEFKVLNTTYPNNMITLFAPILKLDVSDITSNNGNSYTKTYPHHINLNVSSKITAQIEKNTNLIFTTNDSNPENFTVRYIVDEYYDDVIRFGLENVSYVLQNNAIEITFSDVSSSFNTYIRQNTSDSYKLITPYGSIINNGTHAWNLINVNNSGALYTYNDTTRTGTVWTSHLTDFKGNSSYSSSDDDDSDGNAPTLGKASSGAQLVTNGFEYNNLAVNVGRYHTEFPLIGTNVGDINTIKIKIYDSAGPTGIKRVELALGVPDVGLYHEAEAFIEIWMQRDSIAVQEIIIEDKLNLLEDSDVSSTVSQISCTGDVQQCLLVELKYSYREPPVYNTVSIKPVDWDNNAHQFYFNDGIHVDGDSINLPKEIDISASHAANTMHATGALHLIQIDRAEHLWVDQYGYQWMIMGNTVRQITVPEYLVPNDNTFGTLHGPDRNHPEFASTIYAEQLKAQETLAEILGHATIIKPLPESGGTIYFDATGTDSRSGDSFKLVLELETARMQQLSNLLYDDTS